MGADWHPYIEERINGVWAPKWKPIPDPDWWYEDLVERKIDDGSARMMFSTVDESKYWEVLSRYYKEVPWPEVMEQFSDHPDTILMWYEHSNPDYWDLKTKNLPVDDDTHRYGYRFKSRDYSWFSLFGVRRSQEDPWIETHPDIPKDVSKTVLREFQRYDSDAHSTQWIMVDELLKELTNLKLDQRPQAQWLMQYVDNPSQTRLIFWFDN